MKKKKVHPEVNCPICNTVFIQNRSNKKYCSEKCQKNSSRKKTGRKFEYKFQHRDHDERAAWLTYDVTRLPETERNLMIQKLLERASHEPLRSEDGEASGIRRILLDQRLLGAAKDSPFGRFRHDQKCGVPNIAKQVFKFCMDNYGCSTKDCILDGGKPAKRSFVGDPVKPEDKTIKPRKPVSIPTDEKLADKFFRTYGMVIPSLEDDYQRITKVVFKTQAAADLVPQSRVEELELQTRRREKWLAALGIEKAEARIVSNSFDDWLDDVEEYLLENIAA